jgi:hypothetical protein
MSPAMALARASFLAATLTESLWAKCADAIRRAPTTGPESVRFLASWQAWPRLGARAGESDRVGGSQRFLACRRADVG